MVSSRVVSTGYRPRRHQDFLHARVRRFNVILAHRRFGKTIFCLNEMVDRALRNPRKNPQYAYIAPTYGAAKRISWDFLKEILRDVPGVEYRETELKAIIPRSDKRDEIRIFLLGAEKPAAIRGVYLDGVVLDEYSEQDPTVFTQVVRPALSDREGWAIFIFTPKGSNHAYEMYRHATSDKTGTWFACRFKASETGVIPQAELEAAAAIMGPEEYEQEYECSFTAALVGAYYKAEMGLAQKEGRIAKVPYDNHSRVTTAWDLGMDDSTVVWFIQECGRELHVIDHLEVSSKGLPEIVKMIRDKPYDYAEHLLPHDAAARELGTGKSRVEIIKKLGLKNVRIAPRLKREDGIAAVRSILGRMWFDEGECGYGIEALKSYERVFDNRENVFKTVPKHNWASHSADALRTFATGYRLEEDRPMKGDLQRYAESSYDVFGWE